MLIELTVGNDTRLCCWGYDHHSLLSSIPDFCKLALVWGWFYTISLGHVLWFSFLWAKCYSDYVLLLPRTVFCLFCLLDHLFMNWDFSCVISLYCSFHFFFRTTGSVLIWLICILNPARVRVANCSSILLTLWRKIGQIWLISIDGFIR